MASPKTNILGHTEILTKLERMACEICEKHVNSKQITLCGLNDRGYYLVELLGHEIQAINPNVQISYANATVEDQQVTFSGDSNFSGKHVLVMDDVINTGYTLMLGLSEVFKHSPVSIGTIFLAKREHRNFPVKADYVGVSIATTIQEHVQFDNSDPNNLSVYLV